MANYKQGWQFVKIKDFPRNNDIHDRIEPPYESEEDNMWAYVDEYGDIHSEKPREEPHKKESEKVKPISKPKSEPKAEIREVAYKPSPAANAAISFSQKVLERSHKRAYQQAIYALLEKLLFDTPYVSIEYYDTCPSEYERDEAPWCGKSVYIVRDNAEKLRLVIQLSTNMVYFPTRYSINDPRYVEFRMDTKLVDWSKIYEKLWSISSPNLSSKEKKSLSTEENEFIQLLREVVRYG